MNRLDYACDLIGDASDLLLANLNGFDKHHFGIVRRVAAQLSIYREAALMTKGVAIWSKNVSEELRRDVDVTTGHEVTSMMPADLLDEYVCLRLESTTHALLSIEDGYLDADDSIRSSFGCMVFEARYWLEAALSALCEEASDLSKSSLKVAA